MMLQIILVCWLAGMAAWRLHHHLQRGPVLASAVVSLTAGLLLPALFENGATLAAVAACASYVGMSANIRLRSALDISVALLLAAVLFVVAADIFVGVGGKLGTIAAVSVMAVWGATQILERLSWRTGLMARIVSRIF